MKVLAYPYKSIIKNRGGVLEDVAQADSSSGWWWWNGIEIGELQQRLTDEHETKNREIRQPEREGKWKVTRIWIQSVLTSAKPVRMGGGKVLKSSRKHSSAILGSGVGFHSGCSCHWFGAKLFRKETSLNENDSEPLLCFLTRSRSSGVLYGIGTTFSSNN